MMTNVRLKKFIRPQKIIFQNTMKKNPQKYIQRLIHVFELSSTEVITQRKNVNSNFKKLLT